MVGLISSVFLTHILCTQPLIGGINTENEMDRFSGWVLPKYCDAKVDFDRQLIMINCKNGEKFMLPVSQCSISIVKKEENKQ